jgi:hypothetical protein
VKRIANRAEFEGRWFHEEPVPGALVASTCLWRMHDAHSLVVGAVRYVGVQMSKLGIGDAEGREISRSDGVGGGRCGDGVAEEIDR